MDFCGIPIGKIEPKDIPQLSGRYGCNVSVQDESENGASHTVKDRRNASVLSQDGHIEKPIWYVNITSGNGISLGMMCQAYTAATGRKRYALHLVDVSVHETVKNALAAYGTVREMDLGNRPVPNNTLAQLARDIIADDSAEYRVVERVGDGKGGYGSLAEGLYPFGAGYWFVPVGEGEMMTHLALALHNKTPRPKIVGVTIKDNVFASGRKFKRRVKRSPMDKLVTPYSDYKDMLLELCRTDGHEIMLIKDNEGLKEYGYLRSELMMEVEPSAAAPFAGLKKYAKKNGLGMGDRVIVISTGRGVFPPVVMNSRAKRNLGAVAASAALTAGGIWAYGNHAQLEKERKSADAFREWAEERMVENLRDKTFWRDYVAFAEFKALQEKDVEKRERVRDEIIFTLEWHNAGPADRAVVEGRPERRAIVDEFYQWKNRKK